MDYIKSNDINKAKLVLGNLFIYISDVQDVLSIRINKRITLLKDEFLESAKGRSWFGTPRFKDKPKLLKTLTRLIFDVNTKTDSLKAFLNK